MIGGSCVWLVYDDSIGLETMAILSDQWGDVHENAQIPRALCFQTEMIQILRPWETRMKRFASSRRFHFQPWVRRWAWLLNLFFSVVEFWWRLRQAAVSYFSRIALVIANSPGAEGRSSFLCCRCSCFADSNEKENANIIFSALNHSHKLAFAQLLSARGNKRQLSGCFEVALYTFSINKFTKATIAVGQTLRSTIVLQLF